MPHLALAAALAGPLFLGPVATTEPAPQPPITLTAEQSTELCQERIPARLARIDRLQERIDGDTTVLGSTAWLQARLEKAEGSDRGPVVERLRKRIESRPQLVERLTEAESRITAFRDEQCAQ